MKKQTKKTPSTSPFITILTEAIVKRLSGDTYFQRGLQYFKQGYVEELTEYDTRIVATVAGTRTYKVGFTAAAKGLSYTCSCPLGRDGEFCKHCVAAALAWLDTASSTKGGTSSGKGFTTLAEGIATLEKSDLVEILVELALENKGLQKKLQLRLAAQGESGGDLGAVREMIDAATEFDEYYGQYGYDNYDYNEGYSSLEELEDVCNELERLIKSSKAGQEVIGLIEYAMEQIGEGLGQIDDSEGEFYSVLENLTLLHEQACIALRPDPVDLAERLFERETDGDEWGTYSNSYQRYAKALGTKGRARFRQLAEAEWKKLPRQQSSSGGGRLGGDHYRITSIMKGIAEYDKDRDGLVEIMQRDLSGVRNYFEIAEVYHNNKLYDKALEWAEKGAKKFPEEMWHQNYNFLIAEYLRHKRYDNALTTAWTWLTRQPSIESCQQLIKVAVSAKKEKLWREKAFAFLRWEGPGSEKIRPSTRGNRSILVEVLLAEKKIGQAWDEAVDGGCNDSLWMKLAAERGKSHPTDALWVYEAFIDELTESADRTSYERIVALLKLTAPLMKQLGQVDEFSAMVDGLRETWKRRRSFIELLNEAFPQKKMGKN